MDSARSTFCMGTENRRVVQASALAGALFTEVIEDRDLLALPVHQDRQTLVDCRAVQVQRAQMRDYVVAQFPGDTVQGSSDGGLMNAEDSSDFAQLSLAFKTPQEQLSFFFGERFAR